MDTAAARTNDTTRRRLLMVRRYIFKDGWAGSAHRFLHVARGLTALAWDVEALEASYEKTPATPSASADFPGRVVQTDQRALWLNRFGLRRLWHRLVDPQGAFRDPERGWGRRAAHWYAEAPHHGPPDVIWAVSCGELSGAVAGRLLSELLGRPWVFELRDPCPAPGQTLSELQARSLEMCLESCAKVVTTTQALADHLEGEHAACRGKTVAIRHCYDESIPPTERRRAPDDPFVILHAGYLRGGTGRNADHMVRALAMAFEMKPEARGRIELHLLGTGQGIEQAVKLGAELGIPESVVVKPQVSAVEATRAMDESDVLLLLKFPDLEHNLQVPGKTYHYMGRGRPILGLMHECEAAEILRGSGLGLVLRHEDTEGIARTIVELWRNRQDPSVVVQPDWDYISQYSESAMAARLDELLRGLLPG